MGGSSDCENGFEFAFVKHGASEMKIGVTGASGFIGRRFISLANERGHTVIGFSRNATQPQPGCVETRLFAHGEPVDLGGCKALVHLAGESVAGLWTTAKKARIRNSRVSGTRQLVDALLASPSPPGVLVSGSAIGFYGDTGEVITDETSGPGAGFLAEVCGAWEAEALRARAAGVRVVLLRTGMVLGKNGGAMSGARRPDR